MLSCPLSTRLLQYTHAALRSWIHFQTLGCHCRDLSGEKSSAQRLLLTTHRILSTMLIYIVFYKILYYRSIMIYMYIIVYIYIYHTVLYSINMYSIISYWANTSWAEAPPRAGGIQDPCPWTPSQWHRGVASWIMQQAGVSLRDSPIGISSGIIRINIILVLLYMIISDYRL